MGKYVSEETRQAILNEKGPAYRFQTMDKVFWDIYDGYRAGKIDPEIYNEAYKHKQAGGRFADDFFTMLIAEENEKEENRRQKVLDSIWHEFSGSDESMPEIPKPNIVVIHDKEFPEIIRDIALVYPDTIPPVSFIKAGIFNVDTKVLSNNRSLNVNLCGKVYELQADSSVDLERLDFKKLDKKQNSINLNYYHHLIDEKPFLDVAYKED